MYVLRYRPEIPLNKRKHEFTAGRYPSAADAEWARDMLPAEVRDLLETQGPRDEERR